MSIETIRREKPEDVRAIHAMDSASFPTEDEARLVDALRETGHLRVSLVAVDEEQFVGHVGFSPVSLAGATDGVGLAPLVVPQGHRRRCVGAQLVREGIAACKRAGFGFVVVLGIPDRDWRRTRSNGSPIRDHCRIRSIFLGGNT